MSYQVEIDWPDDHTSRAEIWSFDALPREGEVIHDMRTSKSAQVQRVVWFLNERGVKHVRLVLGVRESEGKVTDG